ncbi:MAG: hypothetical protein M3548_07605 [Actinomycetota bacterium]|nr:hypothetical protein [Actinomycetota bacterium]
MFNGESSVRVSATIDIDENTQVRCVVDKTTGGTEVCLGTDAYLFLTKGGTAKLVEALAGDGRG